jgi:hypothetical protein
MGREILNAQSFPPHLVDRLQGAFDDVLREMSPHITDANRDEVSAAIAEALVSLAHVGQHGRQRLWIYALAQAKIAIDHQ